MGGLLERAMAGHLGSVISSMGRWRMRLEVPYAEVAEMLPLARLLSRSTDPAVRSRSKVVVHLNHPTRKILCVELLIQHFCRKVQKFCSPDLLGYI